MRINNINITTCERDYVDLIFRNEFKHLFDDEEELREAVYYLNLQRYLSVLLCSLIMSLFQVLYSISKTFLSGNGTF